MEFSPTDRQTILDAVAEKIAREIADESSALADMVLLPMGVAEQMLSLDARTIRREIPWIEVAPKKHRVRLSDVRAYISARTRNARIPA